MESKRAVIVKGDDCSFRHDINKRAKMTQPNPSPSSFMQQNERSASRTRSSRGKSPSGRMFRWPCKENLKGTCTNSFCEKWHPPVCLFYKSENGCKFGEKCSYAHRQVDEQPSKRSKKNGDKKCSGYAEKYTTIGLRISGYGAAEVFIDFAEELKHTETNPMCSQSTKAVVRHANIRDQNPSLGLICPGDPHQRNSNAPKFEDRSQEETE